MVRPCACCGRELGGEERRLSDWIGPTALDLRLTGGEPGVRRFSIATSGGEILFEP